MRAHFLGIGGETGNEAGNRDFIGEFKELEETGLFRMRNAERGMRSEENDEDDENEMGYPPAHWAFRESART